jgi:Uma2 family endonuclease
MHGSIGVIRIGLTSEFLTGGEAVMDSKSPEEERFEKIGGKLLSMSPSPSLSHNFVVNNLVHIFSNHLRGKKCKLFTQVDVHLSESDVFVPDFMVVCDSKDAAEGNLWSAGFGCRGAVAKDSRN